MAKVLAGKPVAGAEGPTTAAGTGGGSSPGHQPKPRPKEVGSVAAYLGEDKGKHADAGPGNYMKPKAKHRPIKLIHSYETTMGKLELFARFTPAPEGGVPLGFEELPINVDAQSPLPEGRDKAQILREKKKEEMKEAAKDKLVPPPPDGPPPGPELPTPPPPTGPHPDEIRELIQKTAEATANA